MKANPGVGARENDIQANCFMFSEGQVFTYNDEISIRTDIPAELNDLECIVQAKEFLTFLNKMSNKEIAIKNTGEHLAVRGKDIEAEIVIETEVRMPIDEIAIPEKWKDLDSEFVTALKLCVPVVGKDLSKPLSTCLHLHKDKVEVSDTDRAARYTLKNPVFKKEIYFPGDSARVVARLLAGKSIQYGVTEGWIHFNLEDGDTIISCRTYYDGQPFADITPLLDAEGTVVVLPENTANALDRSEVFTSSHNATDITAAEEKYVTIEFADGLCLIKSQGGIGRCLEKMKTDYDGPDVTFSTKVEILAEALDKERTFEVCEGLIKIYDDSFCHLIATDTPKKD